THNVALDEIYPLKLDLASKVATPYQKLLEFQKSHDATWFSNTPIS
ncbi:9236_t:CDS:1, partial [Racocetra fulgida]